MRFASVGLALTLLAGVMTTSALAATGASDDGTESSEKTASKQITVTLPVSTTLNVKNDIHPETPAPFTFTMVPEPEDSEEPVPLAIDDTGEEETVEPATITIHGEGTGEFDVTFTEPGTYTYRIDQVDGDHDGYTYDQAEYLVKVRVSYNRYGELQTYTIVDKQGTDEKSPEVVFLNEYEGTPIIETEEPTTSPEPTTPVTSETPAVESPAPTTSTAVSAPTTNTVTQTIAKGAAVTPKTGDSSNLFRWVVVLAVMLMGAVTCVWYLVVTKKHNRNNES
jgi:pilin isopeptide linkage protein